jgi:hypothetical protein
LGGSDERGKKSMGQPAKLLWEMMKKSRTWQLSLLHKQVNDVQIWQICTQKLGIVARYLRGVS